MGRQTHILTSIEELLWIRLLLNLQIHKWAVEAQVLLHSTQKTGGACFTSPILLWVFPPADALWFFIYLFFSPSNRFLGKGSHGIVPKLLTKHVAMAFSEINSIEGIVLVTGCWLFLANKYFSCHSLSHQSSSSMMKEELFLQLNSLLWVLHHATASCFHAIYQRGWLLLLQLPADARQVIFSSAATLRYLWQNALKTIHLSISKRFTELQQYQILTKVLVLLVI